MVGTSTIYASSPGLFEARRLPGERRVAQRFHNSLFIAGFRVRLTYLKNKKLENVDQGHLWSTFSSFFDLYSVEVKLYDSSFDTASGALLLHMMIALGNMAPTG